MDWGLALLGGGFVMLWLVFRAVIRWIEVRTYLRVWGPGVPSAPDSTDKPGAYAPMQR